MSGSKERKARQVCIGRLIETYNIALKAKKDENQKAILKVRYENFDDIYEEFKLKHNEVISEVKTDDEFKVEDKIRMDTDDFYYKTKVLKHELFPDSNQFPNYVMNNSHSSPGASVKLPKITIPTFDGNLHTWPTFYDLFCSLIHNNQDLNNIEKFQYLISFLDREPMNLIKSIQRTDANYSIAFQTLEKRYQNKRLLATTYWNSIYNASPLKVNSSRGLRILLDIFNENVASLKELAFPVDQWCFILFNLLLQKLDSNTKTSFELKFCDVDIPTYANLTEFLEQQCKALENVHHGSPAVERPTFTFKTPPMRQGNGNSYSKPYISSRPPVSLATETNNSSNETRPTFTCKCCKNAQHPISQCPSFVAKSPKDRLIFAKTKSLCINCLRPSHVVKDCISTFNCRVCRQRHHSMLHLNVNDSVNHTSPNNPNSNANSSESPSGSNHNNNLSPNPPVNTMTSTYKNSIVMLSTAVVDILDSRGNYQKVRILLDSASQANFITESCLNRLGLTRQNYSTPVLGLNQSSSYSKGITHCTVKPQGLLDPKLSFEALILPKLCSDLPPIKVSRENWIHLSNVQLADVNCNIPEAVDMLIGAELQPYILKSGRIIGDEGKPSAFETIFGWVLIGKINNYNFRENPQINSYFTTVDSSLENNLKRFWEMESIPDKLHVSPDDQKCEALFKNSLSRDSTGRFIVSLPFRHSAPDLGDTYSMAARRFSLLESRLLKNPTLYSSYKEFLNEYLDNEYLTLVSPSEPKSKDLCYLPHHCILRPDKATTKIRVVFDGSAKGSKGISINDTLLTGPKLQCDINSILLHFRFHPIVCIADIKQMYLQIKVATHHQNYQRILWRFDQDQPLQEYKLNRITFGLSSSPFLAIRTLRELAVLNQEKYPIASEIVLNNTFVDDVIFGADSVEQCLAIQKDLIALLQLGCFQLRKWATNDYHLLTSLPEDDRQQPLSFDKEEPFCLKVLGLQWDPNSDQFSYSYHDTKKPCTKRNILSDIARLYDPLGFISPVSFFAKHLMQQLWSDRVGWDETPSTTLIDRWLQFKSELHLLSQFSIPRYIFSKNVQRCELHGFADASEIGYAAAVYVRVECTDGTIQSFLVMAKTKVAPLKTLSIPRLELCGAVLLVDVLSFAKTTYSKNIVIDQILAYSDSEVVLAWLAASPHKWKSFVANRVSYIQDTLPEVPWFHVKSENNPADCASRGLSPRQLLHHPLWFTGPKCLVMPATHWNLTSGSLETAEELKPIALTVQVEVNIVDQLLNKFSSFRKIQGILAFCFRIIHNYRNKNSKLLGPLASSELQHALMFMVKHTQNQNFPDLIIQITNNELVSKQVRKLSPFLDEDGFVRVGGRLRNSSLSFEAKHPLLLPRVSRLTEILIDHIHKTHLHPGLNTVQYLLRQQFWILSSRRAIQHSLSQCLRCFRLKPKTYTPYMGDLPSFRISQLKAFAHTAVDYAGPFSITMSKCRGAKKLKAYICIFVCCATKAIHIELASDLSSEAFVAAFRRFIARRGTCSNLYSDCGTNFVGANNLFREYAQQASEKLNISWFFNPPASPHFNGLSEASVKSVKGHLYRVIGDQILTYEELYTLLTQIESVLNSRPLCAQSSDPNDLSPLTPGHFLTLEPLNSCPDPDLSSLQLNRLTRWQLIQRLNADFWKRWHLEYLNTLQQRSKWLDKRTEVKVNTLVLLKNELKSPLHWSLGRIVELHPGQDGHIRVVTVKTQQGLFRRPIVKLCPLPTCQPSN